MTDARLGENSAMDEQLAAIGGRGTRDQRRHFSAELSRQLRRNMIRQASGRALSANARLIQIARRSSLTERRVVIATNTGKCARPGLGSWRRSSWCNSEPFCLEVHHSGLSMTVRCRATSRGIDQDAKQASGSLVQEQGGLRYCRWVRPRAPSESKILAMPIGLVSRHSPSGYVSAIGLPDISWRGRLHS
jgi:hypothetical protein